MAAAKKPWFVFSICWHSKSALFLQMTYIFEKKKEKEKASKSGM